ncbi:MAG: hypothetical protein RPU32_09360 [Candidatus Sedimenticola sp. (ex Thyasira tokunagai)]
MKDQNGGQDSKSSEEEVNDKVELLLENITPEKINLSRTSAYAATGASLAILLVLLQLKTLSVALEVALFSGALAIPFLIFYANLNETFLWLGEEAYERYRKINRTKALIVIMLSGYALFALSFFSIIWHMSVWLAIATFILSFALISTNDYVLTQLNLEIRSNRN